MDKEIKVSPVSEKRFYRCLDDLKEDVREEIETYLELYRYSIDHFEFGRIPNYRTYRIVLFDGNYKEWHVKKID